MPGDSPAKIKRFRIAFSFAGEKRDFVKQVADLLAAQFTEAAILYDKYHEAEFARNDLSIYLPNLYNGEADLIVVIVCPDYDVKEWTGLEWLAIHDLLQQRSRKEVMLCRFAQAKVDGLFRGAGFSELDDKTPAQAATLILERLALNEGKPRNYYALTRYDEDLALLGIGALPTKEDIKKHDGANLSEQEQFRRRRAIAMEMKDREATEYSIEDVFQLTSPMTGAKEQLSLLPVANDNKTAPTNLLKLPLNIKLAYVAPLRLLTGLVTRLSDNWPSIVSSYSTLAGTKTGTLDDFHYFVEFCWLSWGPSVDTSFMVSQPIGGFVVAQAALGDEANSLPLIVEKSCWDNAFGNFAKDRGIGWPLKLAKLWVVNPEKDDYFKDLRDHELFRDLFADGIALYFHGESAATCGCGKEIPYYSTAYVWLMLEEISPSPLGSPDILSDRIPNADLAPGRILPLFEHANLASKIGRKFLMECLARKAIHHILLCDRVPDYQERGYYRYATALFDEETVEILNEQIEKLTKDDKKIVAKRLVIPGKASRRTSEDVVRFVNGLQSAVLKALNPS